MPRRSCHICLASPFTMDISEIATRPCLEDNVRREGAPSHLPLCVDLDGTLLRTDTLLEGLVRLGLGRGLFSALGALPRGRASSKAAVAEHVALKASLLPYHEGLLAWLREQKKQ